jgi:hypothetical protein
MESSKFSIILLFILLFYLVLLIVVNRAIIYRGFKTFDLEEDEIKNKLPLLLASNLTVFISLFFLLKPFVNFITYQLNTKEGLFYIFSICSIVFILNIILLIVSFILSKFISTFMIKTKNTVLHALLWLIISSILIVLTSEFYNQISSTNAFNIY